MGDQIFSILSIQYLLFLSFEFYGPLCNASPIVGKNIKFTMKNEFTFIVSFSRKIHYGPKENHFCGGSLISKLHVLSSAHCFADEKLSNVIANIGSNKVGSGDRYEIQSSMTFNKWVRLQKCLICAYYINDVIIITLSEKVTNINPGVISFSKDKDNYGKDVVTAGWGISNDGQTQRYLKKAYLKVLSIEECRKHLYTIYGEQLEVPYNLLCTAADPVVTLGGGDSGGPLMDVHTQEIIGINDSDCTNPNKTCHAINLHISIDYYRHFIDSYTKNKTVNPQLL